MILIFSNRKLEESTNKIINWLTFYNAEFTRINFEDLYETIHIEEGNIYINNKILDISKINVCYYRRFFNDDIFSIFSNKEFKYNDSVASFDISLKSETAQIAGYIFKKLESLPWISNPLTQIRVNKLYILEVAKELQFNIPEYIITTRKKDLVSFYKKNNEQIISKSISDVSSIYMDNYFFNFLTQRVSSDFIETVDNTFFPSFFQKEVEKEYEVRVFFFIDKIFSVVIFSQKNSNTIVDYRNYDYTDPNIETRYKLPEDIEQKIIYFFKKVGLNTGSIDLIKEKKTNKYFFLEVNPVGQFDNVSYNGGYEIEKYIALKLNSF